MSKSIYMALGVCFRFTYNRAFHLDMRILYSIMIFTVKISKELLL